MIRQKNQAIQANSELTLMFVLELEDKDIKTVINVFYVFKN